MTKTLGRTFWWRLLFGADTGETTCQAVPDQRSPDGTPYDVAVNSGQPATEFFRIVAI